MSSNHPVPIVVFSKLHIISFDHIPPKILAVGETSYHSIRMRFTRVLLQPQTRLILFTRANCSLCETAKSTVAQIRARKDLEYREIDVMADGQTQWKDMYEFDAPVLHVQPITKGSTESDLVSGAQKLWHRFSVQEVEDAIHESAEKS